MNTETESPELDATESLQVLVTLIGMAKVACPLSKKQEQCAVDSVFVLARKAGVQESEIYRIMGISPV